MFTNLVADASEPCQNFRLATVRLSWVVEAPMNPPRLAREHRTAFLGVVTNRYYVIEFLAGELADRFGTMAGDVDADLLHSGDRLGPDETLDNACTFHLELIAAVVSQQTLGHLAAGRIAGAKDQHSFLVFHILLFDSAHEPLS